MGSLAVSLPLSQDSQDGYLMLKDYKSVIKQNLKCLVLTIPGERMMEPSYGVGLKTYLFQSTQEGIHLQIEDKIRDQVRLYMPVVRIEEIQFQLGTLSLDSNNLFLQIVYSIPNVGAFDLLEVTI